MPVSCRFDPTGAWDPDVEARLDLFGELDDHLRAIALIASHASGLDGVDRDAVRVCLDPHMGWRGRLDAFRRVMDEAAMSVQVRDVDALFDGPEHPRGPCGEEDAFEERWDDHTMRAQRKELLRVLLDLAATSTRSRWNLLRTSRHAVVSMELRTRGIETQPALGVEDPDDVDVLLTELDPVVRPIARCLLDSEILGPTQLVRMLSGVQDPELDVVEAAVDTLPSRARRTLRTLAVSRAETPCNGAAGPFPWAGVPVPSHPAGRGSAPPPAVRREDFELLCSRGLVVRSGAAWRIPRQVREPVLRIARALDEEAVRATHAILARTLDGNTSEAEAERHHHAVEAGDVELATSTATMYAADLRSIGYRLSRRAFASPSRSRKRELYRSAAAAYRVLVEDFDSTDPYAWEYYAYNLERAGASFEEVEAAYRRACEHDPGNPLYRGRWIGHLAAHGQDVVGLFGWWLGVYREDWGEAGMRWFADPVLRAARRSRQGDVYQGICARYGFILRRSPRLRRLMEEHGRRVVRSSRSRS